MTRYYIRRVRIARQRPAPAPAPSDPDRQVLTLSLLAAAIGLAAGYAAYGLYALIALVSNAVFYHRISTTLASPLHHQLGAWVIAIPAVGGLIVGAMAKWGSSRIRGHGIPEAIEAVLVSESRIEPRVAVLKPLSAAIAIGTGGPFGAEGPIIQTGGAMGSLVGQLLHTTPAERKVLLACGAAAGMAATFSTPIAAVILAIELLLFEFRARSFIPLVVASTLATTVHVALLGPGPMFTVGASDFRIPWALPWYVLLGLVCGLAAVALTRGLYWLEDLFERLPVDELWWPAIGGIGVGLAGWLAPRVLGVGYDTITDILNGRLLIVGLLAVVVFKTLALLLSLGSGTSGGLLAPMMMIGAAIGGVFARVADALWPALHLDPTALALVGMAAVFGAAARATFTFIVFAFEITRNYNAVLPLMLVCVVAQAVALWLLPHSIMTEKLARRGLLVHSEFETDPLRQVSVREVMRPAGAGPAVPSVVCYPDETVYDAAERMVRYGLGELPVVRLGAPSDVLGSLSRADVVQARQRRFREERDRQPGWLPITASLRPLAWRRRGGTGTGAPG